MNVRYRFNIFCSTIILRSTTRSARYPLSIFIFSKTTGMGFSVSQINLFAEACKQDRFDKHFQASQGQWIYEYRTPRQV